MAVFIADDDGQPFLSFHVLPEDKTWAGLVISKFKIEVDRESIFAPRADGCPFGALVRLDNQICIVSSLQGGMPGNKYKVPLVVDLPSCDEELSAGFRKWSIYVGEGISRRSLVTIDIS